MRVPHLLFLAAATVAVVFFTGCVSIREGRVVEKRSRAGVANVYQSWLTFRYPEPDVYWVQVEGKDDQGVTRKKSIILFRRDWDQLRVGDYWTCNTGFAPAESGEGK